MKIGIDARFYGTIGKGLGRYVSELIRRLEEIDQRNEYTVFLRKANWDDYAPANPRFKKALAEFPWYGWREQLFYPFWLRGFRLDLMHFPHFNVPFLYRRPFVVTIHDLILLSHPTARATTLGPFFYKLKYAAYRAVIGRAIRDAAAIMTVSNYSRDEIVRRFPAARSKKIEVTYEACAASLAGSTTETESPAPKPYALYVGNAYPHKNLERLIEAFALCRKRGMDAYSLVLVGAPDYFYDRLRTEARSKGLDGNVVFYGQASDEKLAALYANAAFYVFPSLCEGFGLPPLEAMCQGLPVASSNACSLPEVLGDAASYFDPTDVRAIADAMNRLADNESLRNELIEKGRVHSRKFSWNDLAAATAAIYEKALSK
ncbi:glycosyltransferase family 4 protein [Candidatus Uhrbacteria bacterium]|nr:glycosyltransferase family 4 protein [Candidatus Uhrbacteria bacterium]